MIAQQKTIDLSPFTPKDQTEAKALILSGLGDHWGEIDPSLNPDLDNIADAYANATFLVARREGRLIGTGALLPRSTTEAEIVRMSVARDLRRQGVGRLILERLVQQARQDGFQRVILETTETWKEVIAFYLRFGFSITHYKDGDVYFALELEE